jgi:hypothetical protein
VWAIESMVGVASTRHSLTLFLLLALDEWLMI